MNARLDLMAPAAEGNVATAQGSFVCCPRYVAGVDTGPDVLASVAGLAARSAKVLNRAWYLTLRGMASTRQ